MLHILLTCLIVGIKIITNDRSQKLLLLELTASLLFFSPLSSKCLLNKLTLRICLVLYRYLFLTFLCLQLFSATSPHPIDKSPRPSFHTPFYDE